MLHQILGFSNMGFDHNGAKIMGWKSGCHFVIFYHILVVICRKYKY